MGRRVGALERSPAPPGHRAWAACWPARPWELEWHVLAAALAVRARDEPVTADRVRAELGGGPRRTTVAAALRSLRHAGRLPDERAELRARARLLVRALVDAGVWPTQARLLKALGGEAAPLMEARRAALRALVAAGAVDRSRLEDLAYESRSAALRRRGARGASGPTLAVVRALLLAGVWPTRDLVRKALGGEMTSIAAERRAALRALVAAGAVDRVRLEDLAYEARRDAPRRHSACMRARITTPPA